jgi:hypothetical protein
VLDGWFRSGGSCLDWQLQNHRLLSVAQGRQEDDHTVWKLQCIMMNRSITLIDLTKDCHLVLDQFPAPKQQASSLALNVLGKGQLSTRPKTDRYAFVLGRCEAAGAGAKVVRG